MWSKIQEVTSHIWIKLSMAVPAGLLLVEEREIMMILTLAIILVIDCIFGAFLAWRNGKFSWSHLGKKFSKKFLLYFFTLTASFVLHNAFSVFLEWWFYTIGSIITLSEFGSLMNKANRLGLPVQGNIFEGIADKIYRKACVLAGVKYQKPIQKEEE